MLDSNNSRVLVADNGPSYDRGIVAETLDSALWLLKQCRFEQLWLADYLSGGDAKDLAAAAISNNCLPLEVNFIGQDKKQHTELEELLFENGYSLSKGTAGMYVKNMPRILTGTRLWAEGIAPPFDIRPSP